MDINLGSLVPKEALNKLYDDALSPTAKQIGKLGEDAMKTARLILFPLQLASGAQSRFEELVDRLAKRVPESRRIEPPAEIVVPTLEHLRYSSGDDELSKMFEEVLAKSIDGDLDHLVHPAFTGIIKQLCRDEAWILYRLRQCGFEVVDRMDYNKNTNKFFNRVIEQSELPTDELYDFNQMNLYYVHLQSLGLVEWPVHNQVPIMKGNEQTGLRRHSTLQLTEFGKLFVEAAIPANGFDKTNK